MSRQTPKTLEEYADDDRRKVLRMQAGRKRKAAQRHEERAAELRAQAEEIDRTLAS